MTLSRHQRDSSLLRSHIVDMSLASALKRGKTFLRTGSLSGPSDTNETGVTKAHEPTALFPKVDPAIDGEDCDQDCATCEVRLPKGWKIDESDSLYGHVNGWATHAVVATGKTDWVRDVADEKGSVMEAVGQWMSKHDQPENGVCPDSLRYPLHSRKEQR